jgi:hypothetical protein
MTTENDILFAERQQFKQWWLWIILVGVNSVFVAGLIKQVIRGRQFGYKPMSNVELICATGLILLLTIMFVSIRLETIIKSDGIYVRFYPFHIKYKYYTWSSLKKSYVRQYSPIAEYGGWGIRLGLFGKGKAYNISGDKGLQLEFNNNQKLLIGTNKPEELNTVLLSIGQLKP